MGAVGGHWWALADLGAEHLATDPIQGLIPEARNRLEGFCALYAWAVIVQVCRVMSMDGRNPHQAHAPHVTEDTMQPPCVPLVDHNDLLAREEQSLRSVTLVQDGLFNLKLIPSSQKSRGFQTSGSSGNP